MTRDWDIFGIHEQSKVQCPLNQEESSQGSLSEQNGGPEPFGVMFEQANLPSQPTFVPNFGGLDRPTEGISRFDRNDPSSWVWS